MLHYYSSSCALCCPTFLASSLRYIMRFIAAPSKYILQGKSSVAIREPIVAYTYTL